MALPNGLPQISDVGALQGVVDSNLINASSIISVPHTTIVNRAQIPDISKDLKVSMGIERIQTQQVVELQNEFGPNGEKVFSTPNDTNGLIRFVGEWYTNSTVHGAYAIGANGAYVEITFYGTGLNMLSYPNGVSGTDQRATVDGGSEGANLFATLQNGILQGRNYAANVVVPVVKGLTLGIHTVRIRKVDTVGNSLNFMGYEILNETSTINVNSGNAWVNGQTRNVVNASVLAYNSNFESGTLEARGGRVVVYQKDNSEIAKAVQQVDAAQANLSSANHMNEEVIRTYNWREFGAGRGDDFSTLTDAATPSNRAFTLDDGTTTLVARNVIGAGAALECRTVNDSFITLTFVGSGLDIIGNYDGGSADMTVSINGTSVGNIPSTPSTSGNHRVRIASGLPYGTHVVKISRNSGNPFRPVQFITYGPKKPSVPSGVIELADYNVMANFTGNITAGVDNISQGVLRKVCAREFTYVDPNNSTVFILNPSLDIAGQAIVVANGTPSSSAYVEYVFFGTGFEARGYAATTWSANIQVTLNGTTATAGNFPSASMGAYGLWSYNSSTAILSQAGGAGAGNGFRITGLPLGLYILRMRTTSATNGRIGISAIDVITPIHSPKSNLYADLQNTLPVGSCSISDNRKTSLNKLLTPQKAWAQAVGISSGPTTNLTSFAPMPDMSLIIKTPGGSLDISYSVTVRNNTVGQSVICQVYVNGNSVGTPKSFDCSVSGHNQVLSDRVIVPVSAGVHKVDLYWYVNGGIGTAAGTSRTLNVREV